MNAGFSKRVSGSYSDNPKPVVSRVEPSATQNPKLVGIAALVFTFAMCGAVAQAQQPQKIPRIGYLIVASLSSSARFETFRQGLRELGYVEGKNIVIEWRSAEGNLERLPALAAELVHLKVDIIITRGPPATRSAAVATSADFLGSI